jgi:hypothetical protein
MFELVGLPNPTYRSKGKYWVQQQIEAHQCQDSPPIQHKLAVPVAIINHLIEVGLTSTSDKLQASCDMSTIAIYFLLRIGEYMGNVHKGSRGEIQGEDHMAVSSISQKQTSFLTLVPIWMSIQAAVEKVM